MHWDQAWLLGRKERGRGERAAVELWALEQPPTRTRLWLPHSTVLAELPFPLHF